MIKKILTCIHHHLPEILIIVLTSMIIYLCVYDTNNPKATTISVRNIKEQPTNEFKLGETIIVYREVCVSKFVPGNINIEMINVKTKMAYSMGSRPASTHPGCFTRVTSFVIPAYAIPGAYELQAKAYFNVNFLKVLTYLYPVIPFEVK